CGSRWRRLDTRARYRGARRRRPAASSARARALPMRWRSRFTILVVVVTVGGMGKVFEGVDDRLARWIAAQPMFFVGTAPLEPDGHLNVSPKAPIGTLRVLDPSRVAYLDFVGSGAETIAHLRENGRIVIMLCAFSGPPRIVRLHGRGSIVMAGEPGFDELLSSCGFDDVGAVPEARRSIVTVSVDRI